MKTFQSLDAFCPPNTPVALTIGNFDGVHLGHAAVLNRLKSVANYRVVFTFSNHPYEVLKKTAISRLSPLSHRLVLFKEHGVNSTNSHSVYRILLQTTCSRVSSITQAENPLFLFDLRS